MPELNKAFKAVENIDKTVLIYINIINNININIIRVYNN
mgnify:CR=1 FL=1